MCHRLAQIYIIFLFWPFSSCMYTFRSIFIPSLNVWHTATAAVVQRKKTLLRLRLQFSSRMTHQKKRRKEVWPPIAAPPSSHSHTTYTEYNITQKSSFISQYIYKCIFEIHWEENGMRNGRNKKIEMKQHQHQHVPCAGH